MSPISTDMSNGKGDSSLVCGILEQLEEVIDLVYKTREVGNNAKTKERSAGTVKNFAIKHQLAIIGGWAKTKHHKSLVKSLFPSLRVARTPHYVSEAQRYTNEAPDFCLGAWT